MKYIFFYVPLVYSCVTRLKSKSSQVAWLFTYFFPVCIAAISTGIISVNEIQAIPLVVICIYSAYEIGYVYNDAELTKSENNPTLRLDLDQQSYYEVNKSLVYGVRLFISIILTIGVYMFDDRLGVSVLISNTLICIIYIIYNSIRNRGNIFFYSILVWLRYFGFTIIFLPFPVLFLLWITYPFCVTVEFASKKKFNIKALSRLNAFDKYRVIYYSVVLMLFGMVWVSIGGVCFSVLSLTLYFFLYRTVSYVAFAAWYRS